MASGEVVNWLVCDRELFSVALIFGEELLFQIGSCHDLNIFRGSQYTWILSTKLFWYDFIYLRKPLTLLLVVGITWQMVPETAPFAGTWQLYTRNEVDTYGHTDVYMCPVVRWKPWDSGAWLQVGTFSLWQNIHINDPSCRSCFIDSMCIMRKTCEVLAQWEWNFYVQSRRES